MAPTIYLSMGSPPVRSVLIFAKAINLELNIKHLNIPAQENLTPEYLKMNPQHTVPTLVDDDGFILWDSHAIITYLYEKYGKDDNLYPKDIKKRAIIDQRLHFNGSVAFAAAREVVTPVFRGKKEKLTEEDFERLTEVYKFLEAFLEGKKWIAGDDLSIADYSLLATVSTCNVLLEIDAKKFPKLTNWFKRGQALPEYAASKEGLAVFTQLIKHAL